MSLADDFVFHVKSCRLELPRVADDLRWAHANGYWPTTHWIDAEHGADLSESEDDRLRRAPKLDFGVGAFACRQAFAAAPAALARVDVHLAAALFFAGRARQPQLMQPSPQSPLPFLLATVQICTWRVGALARIHQPAREVVHEVRKAAGGLQRLHSTFTVVLGQGPAPAAPVAKQCRICRLRPKADKAGGRCNTCATYFHRNHAERPRSLDDDIRIEPHQRKAARIRRGEGWGAA